MICEVVRRSIQNCSSVPDFKLTKSRGRVNLQNVQLYNVTSGLACPTVKETSLVRKYPENYHKTTSNVIFSITADRKIMHDSLEIKSNDIFKSVFILIALSYLTLCLKH